MLAEKENFSELDTIFSSPDYKKMVIQMEIQAEITNIAKQPLDLFEKASSQMISNLFNKNKKAEARLSKLNSQLSKRLCRNKKSKDIPTEKYEVLFRKMVNCKSKCYLSKEYLKALFEMKVVYLFKTVEIAMKSLIHTAYPKIDPRNFYKWENMLSYFNSIGIKIASFEGYKEVNDLRKVNNNIKHGEMINDEVKKIKEFANENQFTHQNIEIFYKHIKPKIQKFVKLLGEAIIKDLYVFDDSRIDEISKDFKSRMDDKALQQLATKLTERYDYIKWE